MILNDREIIEQRIISPTLPYQARLSNTGYPIISRGVSSYGYDISLGNQMKAFKQHTLNNTSPIDPKSFNPDLLVDLDLHQSDKGAYFILPRHTYALGVSIEHFTLPPNCFGVLTGKSTLARSGLILNTTPLEPGWSGYLTLEMFNAADQDLMVYAFEGIGQVHFFTGNRPEITYADRQGKYQHQGAEIVTARV